MPRGTAKAVRYVRRRKNPKESVSAISASSAVKRRLPYDLRNRHAVDVREPHVAAVVPVGESLVIHAQKMQDRGV